MARYVLGQGRFRRVVYVYGMDLAPGRVSPPYVPLQPFENEAGLGGIRYREVLPFFEFAREVVCFWTLEVGGAPGQIFPYAIVPDGTCDLIFAFGETDPGSFLSITTSEFAEIPLSGGSRFFGIRFFPGVLPRLHPYSLSGLSGQNPEARDWLGSRVGDWEQRFAATRSPEEAVLLARSFLSALFHHLRPFDPRLARSLHLVYASAGSARIEREVADWFSSRQLRRVFESHTGLSPKTFSRVLRFQHVLRAGGNGPVPGPFWLDFGYFDQAHFSKECRLFTGRPPSGLSFWAG
jgi:Helix-turn-helix domain